jgi:hypothetical protein
MPSTYKYTYKVITKGFNFATESKWLNRNYKGHPRLGHYKAILKSLSKGSLKDLSDHSVALSINIPVRTYKLCKSELVLMGLVDTVRLNASTILILVGTTAIANNDKTYESTRVTRLALESIGLSVDTSPLQEEVSMASKEIPFHIVEQHIDGLDYGTPLPYKARKFPSKPSPIEELEVL